MISLIALSSAILLAAWQCYPILKWTSLMISFENRQKIAVFYNRRQRIFITVIAATIMMFVLTIHVLTRIGIVAIAVNGADQKALVDAIVFISPLSIVMLIIMYGSLGFFHLIINMPQQSFLE